MNKIRIICKAVLIFTILLIILSLCGCAKKADPVETAANALHQQITAIQKSLPKECQTEAIDEQFKAQHASVDSVVSSCDLQKEKITQEKIRWQWAFFALVTAIGLYIARKIFK